MCYLTCVDMSVQYGDIHNVLPVSMIPVHRQVDTASPFPTMTLTTKTTYLPSYLSTYLRYSWCWHPKRR